ncbi:MAG: hypothetical protein ACI4XM_01310 [Candidatus Coprovivens sp.]
MKGLLKGVLLVGAAAAVGYFIGKKISENKEEKQEETILNEKTELTEEQRVKYEQIKKEVVKQMKPHMRKMTMIRIAKTLVGMLTMIGVITYVGCLEAERRDNLINGGILQC